MLCIALIASAAFIIVAVDAFHREGGEGELDPQSGTGGFTLLADTLLPIAHDPSTDAGRDALNVIDFYAPGSALEDVTFTRFRLRPGEDASCLNLYQAQRPQSPGRDRGVCLAGSLLVCGDPSRDARRSREPMASAAPRIRRRCDSSDR